MVRPKLVAFLEAFSLLPPAMSIESKRPESTREWLRTLAVLRELVTAKLFHVRQTFLASLHARQASREKRGETVTGAF
jgi:hypothetical protein